MANHDENNNRLNILGMCLVKIPLTNSKNQYEVIFKKGISLPIIQNIVELYREEIIQKESGKSFSPFEDFSAFLTYFKINPEEMIMIIYIDNKESPHTFPKLYLHSKKIMKLYGSNTTTEEIIKVCDGSIEIPRVEGVSGIFFIDLNGYTFFTKVMGNRTDINDVKVHIGGLISALFSFSKKIVGDDSGAKLKEINFGNQIIYTISMNNVIFAYLVDNFTQLLKQYMYIVADEFISRYSKILDNFNDEISVFYKFEDVINTYFDI